MQQAETITRKLERVAEKLAERGQDDLAREVDAVVSDLRRNRGLKDPDVMTTGEAAAALGVRSVFTVKRWARDGILDGFRRGGRILITRASVERLLNSPTVAKQRAAEADLEEFDAGEEALPPMPWLGRKPWEGNEDSAEGESAAH